MLINFRVLFALVKEARLLWWSLGLIFLVPFLISRTSATRENVFLFSGMVLELAGLIVVALGLTELRRLFGKPPLRSDIAGWFRRIPDVFRQPRTVIAYAAAAGGASMFGDARVVQTPAADATPEQRIAALEQNLTGLREEMDRKIPELRRQITTTNERIEQESRERQASHQDIASKLEDFAVGDLHLEFVGLLWVSLGLIETNIPGRIAGWLQSCHLL